MSSQLSIRRVGTPRLDKMERLLHRVCEVLFLLKALNITMASHQITIREDAHSLQSIRRDFLRNLAFVCDFSKGGSTTTAIGLSETTKGCTVWIASNQGANMRTVDFVNTIISHLRNKHTSQDNTQATEESIIHTCISFANQRIRKESALLCRIVVRCNEIAEQSANQSEAPICNWLRRFDKSLSPDMICRLAYDSRHMPEMKALETHLRRNKVVPRPTNGLDYNLQQTRHLIGRLAHHVRAAKNLVADAACLEDLFDALTVKTVDGIEAINRPAPDSHTTIESMLRRMIRSNDNRMNHFQQKLADVDSKIGILPKIVELYEHPQGDIHAEIQILEYFYRHKLSYAAGDRFIACSKPACLCCRLYIRYHPARCSEPDSHQKIYTKWAVPDTQANTLQTMTSVLHDLQQLALDGIDKKWPSTVYRPDSVTGITMSNLTDIDQTSDASDTTCSNDESAEDNDVLHGSEPGTPTSDGTAVLPLMSNRLQEYDIGTALGNASDSDEDEGGVLLL